jgi:hypothetical protein
MQISEAADTNFGITIVLVDSSMSEAQLVDSTVAEEAERLKEKPFGGLRVRLAKFVANGHVSPFPHLVHMQALSQDYTTWGAKDPISIGHSMFEDLLTFYSSSTIQVTQDPATAEIIAQRLVRSKWSGFLKAKLDNY